MVAALRRLGFDKVFDTDFGADMTIMEEATVFIHRVKRAAPCPSSLPVLPDGQVL